ncbi:keratin, type I cytoskeletal 9 [Eurytemora carolleeae]|uniref:keratin, type I cytoskeletal 9 n=1 Tax=Eurytemora carolleeae TaxID=1294199 RepID=UPI000C7595C4|nr:keratin, type I cytoskeletal 9 [Eurytemora carolleeae]|eukprot:XP_023322605.1 keratin, type I cytoskeletal 9-like [Eurytemora affinis]
MHCKILPFLVSCLLMVDGKADLQSTQKDVLTNTLQDNFNPSPKEGRTSEPDGRALVKKILVKHGSTFQPALQAFFNKKQQQQQQVDSLNQRSDNAYTRVPHYSSSDEDLFDKHDWSNDDYGNVKNDLETSGSYNDGYHQTRVPYYGSLYPSYGGVGGIGDIGGIGGVGGIGGIGGGGGYRGGYGYHGYYGYSDGGYGGYPYSYYGVLPLNGGVYGGLGGGIGGIGGGLGGIGGGIGGIGVGIGGIGGGLGGIGGGLSNNQKCIQG